MTTLNTPSQQQAPGSRKSGTHPLRQALVESISRVRTRLIVRACLRWIGVSLGLLMLMIMLDAAFQISVAPRFFLLLILLSATAWFFWKWIQHTLQVHPSQTDLALNLTQQTEQRRNTANIAAYIDLAQSSSDNPIQNALTAAITDSSSNHLEHSTAKAKLRSGPLYEILLIAAGLCMLGVVFFARPELARIGVPRILTPWTDAQWPKQFGVSIPEMSLHHPSDRALAVNAEIGPSSADPDATVRWRLLSPENDQIVRWTTLTLNAQGPRDDEHQLYEQLIPVHTIAAKSFPEGSTLEYRIQTRDDQSPVQRITIVNPPKLIAVHATVTPPAYILDHDLSDLALIAGSRELLQGSLSIGPILAGSDIELRWEFDGPVTNAFVAADSDTASSSVASTFVVDKGSTVRIRAVDEYGLSPRNDIGVFINAIPDAPPEALIAVPRSDQIIGQRANITIQARASDDIGLQASSITLEMGQASDSAGESTEPTIQSLTERTPAQSRLELMESDLDLSTLALEPNDQVEIRAHATDILGLESHSTPRVLRIVEDSEIISRAETQLGTLGEILRRLDDQQRNLIERTQDESQSSNQPSTEDQRALSNQIESRSEAIRAIRETLEESRIRDPQLSPMLDAVEESLAAAAESSQDAEVDLDREQAEDAIEDMEDVRDELGRSMGLLDQGQDTWLARRSIEELRSKVESLLNDTKELGSQTGGQSIDQLSEDERSMLQKILDRQRRVTQEARETIDALDQQAEALEENNPTGAQGIRDAATQGRNSGIEEQLNQAAEELAENQTSSAAGTQQQVLEELDNMIEQIEQAQKKRDSALRRKLASIMESIEAVIEDQKFELDRLDQPNDQLDEAMITLRSNTLSIRDESRAAYPETQGIADSLDRASESQSKAILALRSEPADYQSAREAELAALVHLQAALEEAKRQDEQAAQRQSEQKRDEIRTKYQEALDAQSQLILETEPLVSDRLDRRQRAKARQLAASHADLQELLSAMLEETEELSEAPMFSLAHEQIDLLLERVRGGLAGTSIETSTVLDQQSVAVILQSLVDVLGSGSPGEQSEFEDGQGDGGGGQGGAGGGEQPVIPPIAQLQLLRTLQQLTATQTRTLGEDPDADPARVQQIGDLQRDLAQRGQQLIEQMNPQPPNDEEMNEGTPRNEFGQRSTP